MLSMPAPARAMNFRFVAALIMSTSIKILLLSTILDARDRKRMTIYVAAELLDEQKEARATMASSVAELRSDVHDVLTKLDANTEISQAASDHADKAYHEANDVNNKIARQQKELLDQGDDRDRMAGTIEDTHDKVTDLHDQIKNS